MLHAAYSKRPLGLLAIQAVNLVTGFWIPLPPFNFSSIYTPYFVAYEWILNLGLIFHLLYSQLNDIVSYTEMLSKDLISFLGIYVYTVAFIQSTIRSMLFSSNKSKLIKILESLQSLIDRRIFRQFQAKILKSSPNKPIKTIVIIFVGYCIIQTANVVNLFMNPNYTTKITHHNSSDFDARVYMLQQKTREFDFFLKTVFNTVVATISILKLLSTDVLMLTILNLVTEELILLKNSIKNAIYVNNSNKNIIRNNDNLDLGAWIDFQQTLARILGNINSFSFVYTSIMIGINASNMCLMAYICTKLVSHSSLIVAVLAGYCFLIVIQTFLYCEAGHRLKQQGEGISEAVCRIPWLRTQPYLVPGLQLLVQDCSRSFVVRIGPFFTLSMEFFSSLIGVVLTYFIVLVQFN
ncbi:Odorant receptor 33 [Ephemera danica]|nr:Odorant receptor 33 [Ephemera danica]